MLQLILLLVGFFVLLLLVLHLLFGKELKTALSRLEVLHQDSMEKEDVLSKELERARVLSESEIDRSKEEAKIIIDTAKISAEKITLDAADKAQLEIRKVLSDAAERIKKLERETVALAQDKAVGFAIELLQVALSPGDMEHFHRYLIDNFIRELKGVDKSRITVKPERVVVVSSVALTSSQRDNLKEALTCLLGTEWVLEEKLDESLVAGIALELAGLVIDASLKNKLIKALQILKQK